MDFCRILEYSRSFGTRQEHLRLVLLSNAGSLSISQSFNDPIVRWWHILTASTPPPCPSVR
ncbi:predicted protein [Botrytis cinerea T4]|uniref:Uncharacterized protein n=1 Tax=Botryotinia fuckeliana (strain T4) TaxID=999810 RepID=G2YKY5_BOTF4|nr:predicted protein [Botrytis cinerea T4]